MAIAIVPIGFPPLIGLQARVKVRSQTGLQLQDLLC